MKQRNKIPGGCYKTTLICGRFYGYPIRYWEKIWVYKAHAINNDCVFSCLDPRCCIQEDVEIQSDWIWGIYWNTIIFCCCCVFFFCGCCVVCCGVNGRGLSKKLFRGLKLNSKCWFQTFHFLLSLLGKMICSKLIFLKYHHVENVFMSSSHWKFRNIIYKNRLSFHITSGQTVGPSGFTAL